MPVQTISAGQDHTLGGSHLHLLGRDGPLKRWSTIGYDADIAWIRAECIGGVLEIIVPRLPPVSAPAGYEPNIGLGVASRWRCGSVWSMISTE